MCCVCAKSGMSFGEVSYMLNGTCTSYDVQKHMCADAIHGHIHQEILYLYCN